MSAAPPACDEVLQVLGGRVQLVRERLQILRLQAVVLGQRRQWIGRFGLS